MQELQRREVSRQTATGSPGRIYHWLRLQRLRNVTGSVNPNVIKTRNTITSRMFWHGPGHFLLWKHFHVKPNYNKNKLRKEQGNWGVLLETFPCPAVFLPKAGMNILGKEMRMLRMSSLLGQQERHPTMSCSFYSVAAFPKACSLVLSKCTQDSQKGRYGQINQRNAG